MDQPATTISSSQRTRIGIRIDYDLLLLIGLALLLPALVLLPVPLLRVPLGLALALFAPGYALTAALFAHRDDLDSAIRLALSFGLSVAVLPVMALVLDALPWGVTRWPMIIALSSWIVVLCLMALVRRALLNRTGQAAAPPHIAARAWWADRSSRQKAMLFVGVVGITGVVASGAAAFASTAAVRSTEFYALGSAGLAENYPREVAPGEPMQVQLGIRNQEGQSVSYRIEVRAGTTLLMQAGPISLDNGAAWEQPISYALRQAGDDQIIDFLLFRAAETRPYRELRLWVNVKDRLP